MTIALTGATGFVGQAVLVARADRTGQGALEDAISLLGACPNPP